MRRGRRRAHSTSSEYWKVSSKGLEVVAEGGGGGEGEEEAPGAGDGAVAEGAEAVLADEPGGVGSRELVGVGGVGLAAAEGCDEVAEELRVLRDGVGVVEDDDVAGGLSDEVVEGSSGDVGAIGAGGPSDGGEELGDGLGGAVGGGVVSGEDVDGEVTVLVEEGAERLFDEGAVIVGAHDDGDGLAGAWRHGRWRRQFWLVSLVPKDSMAASTVSEMSKTR